MENSNNWRGFNSEKMKNVLDGIKENLKPFEQIKEKKLQEYNNIFKPKVPFNKIHDCVFVSKDLKIKLDSEGDKNIFSYFGLEIIETELIQSNEIIFAVKPEPIFSKRKK
jgi:hypothetical protein